MSLISKPYFSELERFLRPLRSRKALTPSQATELAKHQEIARKRDTKVAVAPKTTGRDLDDLM